MQQGCSVKRACRVISFDRKAYYYKPIIKSEDEQIKMELKKLSEEYPRYGFTKIYNMLRQQGRAWNHKRVYRLYKELKLNLKIKPKKRLAARTAQQLIQPKKSNICWSLDYMSDALCSGQRFRTANLIDDFNREALGIKVAYGLPSCKLTSWLDDIAIWRGYPQFLRVDNGPENISKQMQLWAKQHNVTLLYIQPGKPAQNAYIERFNRSYREAVLDMYLFKNIREVENHTDKWMKHYNEERPHESLKNMTPMQYAHQLNYST